MPEVHWLSADEAAAHLKIAVGTVRNLTSQKVLPHSKRGRIVRYDRDKLDAWLRLNSCPGRATIADDSAIEGAK